MSISLSKTRVHCVRTILGVVGLCLVMIMASRPLFSQASNGRIQGSVRDQSGAAVPGAKVSVIDVERGITRALTTDDAGQYSAPGLLPGNKTVRAEVMGFKIFEQKNILLEVGQDARIDVVLEPGQINETITVNETPPMLETTSTAIGGTMSNQAINDLPLNGRDFSNLLSLRPGVTVYPGGGGWTQSTNGLRAHDNVYLVNGINNNEPWTGQSILNGATFAGGAGTLLPIDAIQEFRTEVNPKAEFGWKPGAIVNIGLKSGANSLHGTAYAFGRNGAWDAKNYFSPANSSPICATSPDVCNVPLSMQQYGGTVGGPIKKDKLFFFGGYEALRYTVGSIWVVQTPVTVAGVGDATNNLALACAAVPVANRTPLSLKLAGLNSDCTRSSGYPGLFPANTGTTPGGVRNFVPGLVSDAQSDNGIGKLDYRINDRHSVSGMYFVGINNSIFNDAANELQPYWESLLSVKTQVFSGSWIWTPTSNLVNEFRGGYARYYQSFESGDYTVNPLTTPAYGNINTGITNPQYFGFPPITISGFGSFRLGGSWPKIVGPDGVVQFTDHVSLQRGKHGFKFGGELLQNRFNGTITANAKGNMAFPDLQSFFSGSLNRGNILVGNATRGLSSWGYAGFVQDDWRVTPRVTVNLGLRYELNTVFKEDNNLIGNFDPNLGMVQVGKQIDAPFNGDHNNFAPRLGIAWDVGGNGKTVIRAGGSIMHEQLSFDGFMALGNLLGLRAVPTGAELYVNGVKQASPGDINLASVTFSGAAALAPLINGWKNNGASTPIYSAATARCGDGVAVAGVLPTPTPCTTAGVDPNLRSPYVENWTIDIQRALSNNVSLEVGYIGNHGVKLIQYTDINQPRLGAGWGSASSPGSPLANCLASAPLYNKCAVSTAAEQAARPFNSKFPYLNYIDSISNADTSTYNGLQATLTARNYHGLSMIAGYTYSHALDIASDNWGNSTGIVQNSYNSAAEKGNSDFDIRHRATISLTYAIPGKKSRSQLFDGWQINSIVTLQTGQPWSPRDTNANHDFSGTGAISNGSTRAERWNFYGTATDFTSGPNGIPYCNGPSNCTTAGGTQSASASSAMWGQCLAASSGMGQAGVASLTNYGCYVQGNSVLVPPAFGTFGTMSRNFFRDSGFRNVDFSVTKNIRFGERVNAQFRAEVFNILNHPEFTNPGGGPHGGSNADPSTGFGAFAGNATPDTSANNPKLGSGGNRAIQLGLKFIF